MNIGKFYLAHPFNDRHYVKERVQPKMEELLNIEFMNPFSTRPELYEDEEYVHELLKDPKQREIWNPQRIVEDDLRHIMNSNGLIAYVGELSIGTQMEIFFNSYNLMKPTISVIKRGYEHRFWDHPWLKYLTTPVKEGNLNKETLLKELFHGNVNRQYQLSRIFRR